VKAVYVKNLPKNVTQDQLKKLFEHHGKITKVVLPPAKSGQEKSRIGFVHFTERSSAMKALKNTEKYELDGEYAFVSHAFRFFFFFFFKQNQISNVAWVCVDFQAKVWSVLLQNHKRIRSLEDQIHRRQVCFQVIHLVLVMVWLVVPMVLLVQDMALLVQAMAHR
jgi:RNA recognition motif-containing protein